MKSRLISIARHGAALCVLCSMPALSPRFGTAADEIPAALESEATESSTTADTGAVEALQKLAAETVAVMEQAQAGFAEGKLSDETDVLQAGIKERLQQLAELARRQSGTSPSGQSAPSSGRSSPAANAGDGEGAAGRNPDAAESSEAATGPANRNAREKSARDLATSVWGHLPAKQRDRMQSRFSERFLPQYEDLVRQYYEALATEEAPQK